MNEIRYRRPFLTDVIFRVDFPSPIADMQQSLHKSIHKAALKNFPMFEPQQAHSQEIKFEGPEIHARTSQVMQWVFHGPSRDKTLIIEPNSIVVTSKSYKGFDKFRNDVWVIISELFKIYPDVLVGRIGLRYINIIKPSDDNPLSWSDYVDDKMLGIIDLQKEKDCITRAFHILEYNFDGESVKFQFGIANPDYPAVVRRKEFVLDIDSSHQGALEEADIARCLDVSHDRISSLFESSITDETRRLMIPENNEK